MSLTKPFQHQIFDFPLRFYEVMARQIYWRSHFLQKQYAKAKARKGTAKVINLERLKDFYLKIGISNGTNLMIHSKIEGLIVLDENNISLKPLSLSTKILDMFEELVGKNATIAMPTHPLYKNDPGFMSDKRDLIFTYDVKKNASKVGLLTEVFRRKKDVLRSKHPLSSLCTFGPQAKFLIENNLNEKEELPHGIESSYKRFSDIDGKIVSLNFPLIHALAIVHCPEEIKDSNWPIKDFFYKRTFILKDEGYEKKIVVRERHPKWVKFISLKQLRRDLIREDILKEYTLDGIRIDLANAIDVINYMSHRNRNSTYPYFFIPRNFHK